MKASVRWLRDYVNFSLSLDELAEKLTMAGLEVNGIESQAGSWNNVVVSQLVAVEPHPNADRLKLVTVDLGEQQETVVCGAPNLNIGDKVPFASVGAKLVDGRTGETVELKPAKIRGVSSYGMICAEDELGISDNHEGIMVLPPEAPVGIPLADYLGDSVMDLDITPNRPDCLSVIGIATEIAALCRQPMVFPTTTYPEYSRPIEEYVSVEILDPDLCLRYCASLIENVTLGPSPFWMQERLRSCGMRPINNVVDITNYVMMEYGQPLHAFDYKLIRGGTIIVRRAKQGETMTTLDDVERNLDPEMLVIADAEMPVAVAGIMGGADSEVSESTATILLESANFKPFNIRRAAGLLRMGSEASSRFEKVLSPDITMPALQRATQLMAELAGGKPAKGIIDIYPGKSDNKPISLSTVQTKRLLGIKLSIGQIERVLTSLGFECQRIGSSKLEATPPYWRTDIHQTADLIEEVARITGYDRIPTTMLASPLPHLDPNPAISLRERVCDMMVASGFHEVISYSLTSQECTSDMPSLRIINPTSSEQEYLRTTLRQNLLATLAHNQKYEEGGIRLFEIGNVFTPRENDLPQEHEMLLAVASGLRFKRSWMNECASMGFFDAKGTVETLMRSLGLRVDFETAKADYLHPGRTAAMKLGGETIGIVGELHPKLINDYDLFDQAVCLLEINLDLVLGYTSGGLIYQPLARFPGSSRDLALVVDGDIPAKRIEDILRQSPLVSQVSLFDIYTGKQVAEGNKSLAFRILYQAADKTLTDAEINEVEQRFLAELHRQTGAVLRKEYQ